MITKRFHKRLIFLMCCVSLFLLALTTRLVFIQLIDKDRYASVSSMQHRIRLDGTDRRGTIYDRNMEPLTGDTQEYVYIIAKDRMDGRAKELFHQLKARKVPNQSTKYVVYSSETFQKEIAFTLRKDYEAFMIKANRRYAANQTAVHLIGYVNEKDGNGACGLEKDYNEALTQKKKDLYASVDGAGKILPGEGIESEEKKANSGIITTLDKNIQIEAEDVMNASGYKGALVVLDARNGDLLASVSEPSYHPYEVKKYLNSNRSELLNRAVQSQYPPGSTFKIIVCAAALEKGIVTPDTLFTCKGYEEINGVKIKCSSEKGHGRITLKEGFAKSCNCVFMQIGEKLGGESVLKMAEAFGVGQKILPDISDECPGILPSLSDTAGAGIGNLSIGQGKLSMTPLQVAHMTQIIADGGLDTGVKLVKGITCDDIISPTKRQEPKRIISQETAETIGDFMQQVTKIGTARHLKVLEKSGTSESQVNLVDVAGKTGSAQSGPKEKEQVYGWFTAYFPAENPKYVVTTFIENGNEGSDAAVRVFQELAQKMMDNEQKMK